MRTPDPEDRLKSRTHRTVTVLFGLVFIVLAVVILLSIDGPLSLGPVVAAVAVGGLGVDACLAAVRGRRSLLERIGPLP